VSPFTVDGQRRPKILLFWQKSSLPAVLFSPAWGLLLIISVLDDGPQFEQYAHHGGKRFIVLAYEFAVFC
jgi:hypothetical protein